MSTGRNRMGGACFILIKRGGSLVFGLNLPEVNAYRYRRRRPGEAMSSPSDQTAHRRLAAILAADVAGYADLMSRDEEGTLDLLRKLRREGIEPGIRRPPRPPGTPAAAAAPAA